LLAFVVANAMYQAGLQFYDALLPSVSTPATRGRVGGLGVGFGYVGSFIAVGVLLLAPQQGWSAPTQFSMLAGLFLLFALPCFAWVDEIDNPAPGRVWSVAETRRALARTWQTLRSSGEHASLRRFLIGRLFYTDPVNTVIMVMTLYSINVALTSGVDPAAAERIAKLTMFGAIIFAVLGGLTIGRLVDRYGARRVLAWVLGLWCATFALAASLGLFSMAWQWLILISIMAGIALGGTWAADRPLMLELTPPDRLGEFYGLYGMVGRFSAVVGPLLWAGSMTLVQSMGGSTLRAQGVSVLVLLALILVSVVILRPITGAARVGR
jgi:UMF1 family MFS transporter